MFNRPMDYNDSETGAEARLDRVFRAYREAMPDPEPSVNFMPAMWARIEERERSTNWFARFAKGLVTAAVAAYVIVAMVSSPPGKRSKADYNHAYYNGTFVDALMADNISTLEPLHLDRISHLESGR